MKRWNEETHRPGRGGSAIDLSEEMPVNSREANSKAPGFFRRYFVDPLVRSSKPPWFDARGIAAGLVIGFGVPVGAQMLCLGIVRLLIRFNTLIAFAFTWVNNPITLIPMYYGYYYLGSLILGQGEVMTLQGFRELMHPVTQTGYFWESLKAFAHLGGDIVLRWVIGAVITALVAGTSGYVVGYIVQTRRCSRRARRLGISYDRLVVELEKSVENRSEKEAQPRP